MQQLIKFVVSNTSRSRKWCTVARRRAVMENDPWRIWIMESHGQSLGKKCGNLSSASSQCVIFHACKITTESEDCITSNSSVMVHFVHGLCED